MAFPKIGVTPSYCGSLCTSHWILDLSLLPVFVKNAWDFLDGNGVHRQLLTLTWGLEQFLAAELMEQLLHQRVEQGL